MGIFLIIRLTDKNQRVRPPFINHKQTRPSLCTIIGRGWPARVNLPSPVPYILICHKTIVKINTIINGHLVLGI
jgi:hypothetical protein